MSNPNQEIIEARLTSYIDGDLAVGERAEIEQHLQQNPQYRRLLDELRQGREMLRALPREAAPPEFADAFFAQIERAGLLDGDSEESSSRLRINAWPQIAAAAAVIFLTLGLATIVYFVLPRHNSRTIVYVPRPVPAATPQLAETQGAPQDAQEVDPLATRSAAASAEVRKATAPPAKRGEDDLVLQNKRQEQGAQSGLPANGAPIAAPTAPPDELEQLALEVSRDPRVKESLDDVPVAANAPSNALPVASAKAVVMAVRCDDLARVQNELNAYFAAQNIDAQPMSHTIAFALNTTLSHANASDADRAMNMQHDKAAAPNEEKQTPAGKKISRLGDGAWAQEQADSAKPGGPGKGKSTAEQLKTLMPATASEPPAPIGNDRPVLAPGAPRTAPNPNPAPGVNAAAPVASRPPASASAGARPTYMPTSRPATIRASAPAQFQPSISDEATPHPIDQQASQNSAKPGAAGANTAPVNRFFLVRRLSRVQALELTDRLSRAGEVRQAEIDRDYAGAPGDSKITVAKSELASRELGAGETGRLRSTEALAPLPATTRASLDKSTVEKDSVPSRGGAFGGATTRSSDALLEREAASPLAATQKPVAGAERRSASALSRPAFTATTQPVAQDDRIIDVVIVIQTPVAAGPNDRNATTNPATKNVVPIIPSTQPAAGAPSIPAPTAK